ncbi:MAG: alanyl-tRNA editing protein [Bryobacteraceae bacterium]
MTTARLYYQDAYTRSFDAQVVETTENGKRVYLDKTFFYPASGGQPHDTGVLSGAMVTEVVDEGDRIAHVLSEPIAGDVVQAHIDWSRRFDHMQQHSGQHLLSAVFLERFGFETLSFHMGAEASTVDLGTKDLTPDQIATVEERANEIVREAIPLLVSFEDASSVQSLRKESRRTGTLRIIEIQNVDRSACGGTHLRNTAEIGSIQIRGSEKVRGNVRIEFVCGTRAVRRSRRDYQIVAELAKQNAVPPDKLVDSFASVLERLLDAERERDKLKGQVARLEADASYRSTPPSADGLRRILLRTPALDENSRLGATSFAANPRAMCIVVADEPPSVLIACSADSGVNAGAVLKQVLAEKGGRGGGSATLAQAKLPDETAIAAVRDALGFTGD